MRIIKKVLNNSRGQTMVEMAVVVPVLVLILFSMLEFGRMINEIIVVRAAAREGARIAAVQKPDAEIQQRVVQVADSLDGSYPVQVIIQPPQNQRVTGGTVSVTVTHNMWIFTPLISNKFALPNPYPVSATAVMRLE